MTNEAATDETRDDPAGRLEALVRLKEATGCVDANCRTCACSSEDWDGVEVPIYCGMTCSERDSPDLETYLEDQGVDINAEHECWTPNFWHTKFAELIDGTDEADERATRLYRDALEPNNQANSCFVRRLRAFAQSRLMEKLGTGPGDEFYERQR